MKHVIKPIYILLFIISSAILYGCGKGNTQYSKSGLYFDTLVSVTVYGAAPEAAHLPDECMDMCLHYQNLFDPDIKTSDIARINSSAGKPVSVGEETIECLQEALKYCESSGGKFDITIKPVSDLWDFHGESNIIPSDSQLNSACSLVDYTKITIDPVNNTVTLAPGSSIELGALAKGFVADKIGDYLANSSITGAIVNMGGDIRVTGFKPDGSLFNVGINDPNSESSVVMKLALYDTSVATSGTYERYFIKDNRKYHHILDTKTGRPADTDVLSVTVISNRAVDCDCLCTLCVLNGSTSAMDMIEHTDDTEAVLILNDGKILTSSGMGKYIRQQ